DIRYGGGNVVVDSVLQTINPVHIVGAQPTVVHNRITLSADSAMSADPDSFEEVTFHSPKYQSGISPFTADYTRVGPDIYGNTVINNSINGLFIRVLTPAGSQTLKMTVPGRFDDTDIVHVIGQNLEIQGTPGGPLRDSVGPDVSIISVTAAAGGTLTAGTYNYRLVFVDENGFEGPASAVTNSRTLASTGSIQLSQLPVATGSYVGRRIYRSNNAGGGTYTLVGELDTSSSVFIDNGTTLGRTLTAVASRDLARIDARLAIDPGVIVKLEGARIEAEVGAQIIAEGSEGHQVIFTSKLDDRYGAGGTFDTNNNGQASVPSAGNWGGIYIGHMATGSIDRALITFAGGVVPLEGSFAGFNPIEIHQAKVRIRNTVFEDNANGQGGGAPSNRFGLYPNGSATIFVRDAQPVILDNVFRDNTGPVININVNALNSLIVTDPGRSTGLADQQTNYLDNQGPLVRDNAIGSSRPGAINGMLVRGEILTTQSVWDDTDIVHV
ncbi:MAG: hypothetical protein KDA85_18700, partial [Planctomycetaceae bacterium]|nr:hypothetical protein [Planctomycetaceae bacterium]